MPVYLINPLKNKQTKVCQPPHLLFPRLTRKKELLTKQEIKLWGMNSGLSIPLLLLFFFDFLLPANIGEVDWDQHSRNVLI